MQRQNDEEADESLIRWLKVNRHKAGLSIRKLAEKSGIPFQTLNMWEAGLASPQYRNFKKIMKIYGVKNPVEEEENGR